MSNHPIVHIEFAANDRRKAGQFYSDLFGWQFQHLDDFNYTTFSSSPDMGGGINAASQEYPIGMTVFYVGTDDIDATLAHAERLGGKTIMPTMEVTGMGWMGMFEDPDGNKVGLWKEMELAQ